MTWSAIRNLLQVGALKERLQSSLWFVPAGYMCTALLLARALIHVDAGLAPKRSAWFLYGGHADGARELLSTIASSMLTIAGLVFSITIVALQLASSQFSPRVLRTFLRDRVTQRSLGMFLGSFVFAMTVLPQVRSATDDAPENVPSLSVFTAFIMVMVSVLVFVRYIHHMAHSIRAVNVIARIAEETHAAIAVLYPNELEDGLEPVGGPALPLLAPTRRLDRSGPAGVVVAVNEPALAGLATQADLTIAMVPRVGDFVARGAPLARVWGEIGEHGAAIADCVVLGAERTMEQDALFGFRQLVDIAERALSPGVNDPTTAHQVLDHLHDLLRSLCRRSFPSEARVDAEGRLRLVLPRPSWDDYVRTAFEEIRHYGCDSLQVVRAGRRILEDLLGVAAPARAASLHRELRAFEACPAARDEG